MTIFLTILKIIGIILLIILGIVLLLILMVLFLPMHYRVKAVHNEETTDVSIKFRYLIIKVMGSFVKGDGLKYKAKLLFFTVVSSEKKGKKKKKPKADMLDVEWPDDFPEDDEASDEAEASAEAGAEASEQSVEQMTEQSNDASANQITDTSQQSTDDPTLNDSEAEEAEKPGIAEKIENTLDNLDEKYEKAATKLEHVNQFLEKDFVQRTIKRVFKIIKRFFGTIKPKKSKGYLHFGLKSAASTGETLGKIARFYPLFGRWLQIEPDFYHKVIEGDIDIKGRIYLFRFVLPALRILISRDFWRTYKLSKKI